MTDARSMEFIRSHEARERARTGIGEFVQYPTKRTDDISPEDAKELADRATASAEHSQAMEYRAAKSATIASATHTAATRHRIPSPE